MPPNEGNPLISPIGGGFAIIPSDVNDLESIARGIYVGGTGDLRVRMVNDDVVTWPALAAGIIHPMQIIRVYATGTTATGIVGGRD